jgi:hypothetical protein
LKDLLTNTVILRLNSSRPLYSICPPEAQALLARQHHLMRPPLQPLLHHHGLPRQHRSHRLLHLVFIAHDPPPVDS